MKRKTQEELLENTASVNINRHEHLQKIRIEIEKIASRVRDLISDLKISKEPLILSDDFYSTYMYHIFKDSNILLNLVNKLQNETYHSIFKCDQPSLDTSILNEFKSPDFISTVAEHDKELAIKVSQLSFVANTTMSYIDDFPLQASEKELGDFFMEFFSWQEVIILLLKDLHKIGPPAEHNTKNYDDHVKTINKYLLVTNLYPNIQKYVFTESYLNIVPIEREVKLITHGHIFASLIEKYKYPYDPQDYLCEFEECLCDSEMFEKGPNEIAHFLSEKTLLIATQL